MCCCLCAYMCVLFDVCVWIYFVDLTWERVLYMRTVLKYILTYDRGWSSWGDPLWLKGCLHPITITAWCGMIFVVFRCVMWYGKLLITLIDLYCLWVCFKVSTMTIIFHVVRYVLNCVWVCFMICDCMKKMSVVRYMLSCVCYALQDYHSLVVHMW